MNTRTALRRMAAQEFPADDGLQRLVPDAERAHRLRRILGSRRLQPVPEARSRGRRWGPVLVVGVVVVAVLAAVAVFVLPGAVGDRPLDGVAGPAPAPALTPAADPADVLRRLADRADAQPPIPEGRWDYIRTAWWAPPTGPDGQQDLDAPDVRWDTEVWRSPEGGRLEQREQGQVRSEGGIEPAPQVEDLPTDPEALDRVLRAQPADYFREARPCMVMRWIWSDQVVQPQVQAAFLRLLAATGELRLVGAATDRLGRPGVAVEVTERGDLRDLRDPEASGGPAVFTHTLVLDERTGAVLAMETVLVEGGDPELYPGPRPMSTGLTTWVRTGRVATTSDRP